MACVNGHSWKSETEEEVIENESAGSEVGEEASKESLHAAEAEKESMQSSTSRILVATAVFDRSDVLRFLFLRANSILFLQVCELPVLLVGTSMCL